MNQSTHTPIHFWIIAVLALLWNSMGAFDYLATQLRFEPYMSGFTDEQLAYFYGFPTWAMATWAIAVWSAVLASILMLLRSRWAFHLFVLSLAALLVNSIYTLVLTEGIQIMGIGGLIFSLVIVMIAIFLIFYTRAMIRNGVLR